MYSEYRKFCLKCVELVQRFNSFCKLFQTDRAKLEIYIADHSGWLSFIVKFLVEALPMQDMSKTSFMYKGHLSLKNFWKWDIV